MEPSTLAVGDPVLLPPLRDRAGSEAPVEPSNRLLGLFTLQCSACEVSLPTFLDRAATNASALAIVDAPYEEARVQMGPVVDHPSIAFSAEEGSVVDALRVHAIPAFLRLDVDGLLADQGLDLDQLLARDATSETSS